MNNNYFNCFSCNCSKFIKIQKYKYINSSKFSTMFNNLEIFTCQKCGISQINHKLLNENKLIEYYKNHYRKIKNFKEIKNDIDIKYFTQRAKGQIKLFKKYINPREFINILEIGPGSGNGLIELAKSFPNANIYIDEPDSTLNFKYKKSFKIDDNKNLYNVILLSHVLEHIKNPNNYLIKLHAKLKPNGLIIIEVPRQEDVESYQFTEPHLTFFSLDTIKKFIINNLFDYYEILNLTTAGGYQDTKIAQNHRYKNLKLILKIQLIIMKIKPLYIFLKYLKNIFFKKKSNNNIPKFDFSNDSDLDIYNMIHLVLIKK